MANATTVSPPSFDELVDGSPLVFRGRVTAVQSGWSGDGAQRHLATRVTFVVERVLKGEVPGPLTLEFMGGERDGRRLEIVGLPKFEVGERGVYFVENRNGRLCPLTRLRHGRYRIAPETPGGVERVARDDRSPLRDTAAVREPLADGGAVRAASPGGGMSLAEFEGAISERVQSTPQ
jgi:hypothetical protein